MAHARVLEFLGDRGVRGTFFVTGEIAAAQPELVREVAVRATRSGSTDGTTFR